MEPNKTDWHKTDTVEKWKKFSSQEKKLYIADIKARLKKPPTQDVTTWLKQPGLQEIKKAVMTGSNSPGGSPRGGSDEGKAALALVLAKHNEDIDGFKDDDWKKDVHKLVLLHSAIRDMTLDAKHGAFVKAWLKDNSRRGFRLLVLNCEPINYATLKGIYEADDPGKVANYSNLKPKHKLWLTTLREIYGVQHLGSLDGPGGKRTKVEDV